MWEHSHLPPSQHHKPHQTGDVLIYNHITCSDSAVTKAYTDKCSRMYINTGLVRLCDILPPGGGETHVEPLLVEIDEASQHSRGLSLVAADGTGEGIGGGRADCLLVMCHVGDQQTA